jgi:hypothetical protein
LVLMQIGLLQIRNSIWCRVSFCWLILTIKIKYVGNRYPCSINVLGKDIGQLND